MPYLYDKRSAIAHQAPSFNTGSPTIYLFTFKNKYYNQYLTEDIGEPNLEKQINKAITLFQVSDNMKQFWQNFKKMKDRQNGQLELPFDFDDNGHTKE